MKEYSKRVKLITSLMLALIVLIISFASFYPQSIVPISSGNIVGAIYSGNREKKQASIMINVYENTEIVNQMLDVFKEFNVYATFFVGGCWADDNETTLKRIVNDGHEIANHGYFHKDHKLLDYDDNLKEISLTGTIINALCGVTPTLFAPPSGSFSDVTLEVANSLNYKVIMWSKDTIDWRDKDEEKVFSRATKNLENGDLILMHPKAHTVKALPRVLEYFNSLGFLAVTVSENIKT